MVSYIKKLNAIYSSFSTKKKNEADQTHLRCCTETKSSSTSYSLVIISHIELIVSGCPNRVKERHVDVAYYLGILQKAYDSKSFWEVLIRRADFEHKLRSFLCLLLLASGGPGQCSALIWACPILLRCVNRYPGLMNRLSMSSSRPVSSCRMWAPRWQLSMWFTVSGSPQSRQPGIRWPQIWPGQLWIVKSGPFVVGST